ncbi:MAG: response regulator [Hydrogenimonas sp.]|nr:response regulator [Hydrogenimonas sp.]
MNVLIIEDEVIIGLHIETVLEGMGHKVLMIATNGKEALKCADEERVDLVISDIRVDGEKDGIDICEEIQTEHGCAIILITAYKDQGTLKKALGIEVEGYLVKPFNEEELESLVHSVARRYCDA